MGQIHLDQKPVALDSYEEFGESYSEAIESNAYNAFYERPSTMALIPTLKGKRVLDAGCGPGAYTQWLLENEAQVVGIDVSPSMLQSAQKKYSSSQVKFILHDLAKPMTQFEEASFDIILSSLMVHYIRDLSSLFSEFYRILNDQGHVVFSTHHPYMDFSGSISQNYFETELLEQEWNTIGRPVKVRFYRRPLSELTDAIEKAGFVIEKMSEGLLTKDLELKFPKIFAKLSTKPQFLFFRLRK